MDFTALEQNYRPGSYKLPPKPKKQEPNGIQRFLAEAAPIVGGTLGAIGGSFLAPVAGTAAGGAAGSGVGEAIKQALLGEDMDVGQIAQSAAFGAIPGAGKLAKGALGGIKAAAKGESIREGARAAAGVVRPSEALQGGRITRGARSTDMKQSGVQVGQSLRGQTVKPSQADELYDFAREGSKKYIKGGVGAGKPETQARSAEAALKGVTSKMDETLNTIDRKLIGAEKTTLADDITMRVAENAAVTDTTKTMAALLKKVQKADSVRALEAIRREADDLAYTLRGAGKTSAAAQAREVRQAIDDFVTPMSADYKALKGDYIKAKDLVELTAKNSKNAKGLNFFGQEVGSQAIPGAISTASNFIRQLTGGSKQVNQDAIANAFRPSQLIGKGIGQATVQGIGNAAFDTPPEQTEPITPGTSGTDLFAPGGDSGTPASIWQDEEAVQRAYTRAIQAGDKEAANAILGGYKAFGASSGTKKPMSAEAARNVSTAQAGIQALGILRDQLQSNPGVQGRQAISGTFNPFGITSGVLNTGQYEAARDQVKDVIARLRTGAAITKEEQSLFDKYMPQAGDSDETVQQKLGILENQFRFVFERAGGAGTDLQQAVTAASE